MSERVRHAYQAVLQRGDDARHRALREGCGLEQRLKRTANPAGVPARQVCSDHGCIDLRHSPLIARDNRRGPLFHAGASEEGGPRQRQRNGASRPRERPLPDAIAVAASDFTALVRARPERGPKLLVYSRLDRDADVLIDQFAEGDGLKPMRCRSFPDTLSHGAFLRWPPARAAGWLCTSPTGRMRHFSFPPEPGHDLKHGLDPFVSTVAQRALTECLSSGDFHRHIVSMRHSLEQRWRALDAALRRHMPTGLRWTTPAGRTRMRSCKPSSR